MTIAIIAIIVVLGVAYLWTRRSKKKTEPTPITVPGSTHTSPTHSPDPAPPGKDNP